MHSVILKDVLSMDFNSIYRTTAFTWVFTFVISSDLRDGSVLCCLSLYLVKPLKCKKTPSDQQESLPHKSSLKYLSRDKIIASFCIIIKLLLVSVYQVNFSVW